MSGPAGVVEHGISTPRLPRNLGDPGRLQVQSPARGPDYEPLARGWAFWTAGSERQAQHLVLSREAQRSAARGTQGVAHLHSTGEAGEPGPRGPWGGKGDVRHGLVSGTPVEGFVPRSRVPVTLTDSKAGSEAMTRRTGCLSWARPDLWEGWEVTPIPTRLPYNVFIGQSVRPQAIFKQELAERLKAPL